MRRATALLIGLAVGGVLLSMAVAPVVASAQSEPEAPFEPPEPPQAPEPPEPFEPVQPIEPIEPIAPSAPGIPPSPELPEFPEPVPFEDPQPLPYDSDLPESDEDFRRLGAEDDTDNTGTGLVIGSLGGAVVVATALTARRRLAPSRGSSAEIPDQE